MMVGLQPNPNWLDFEEWTFPNSSNYQYKSDNIVMQETIRVEPFDLKECIEKAKSDDDFFYFDYLEDEEIECAIIVGVVGKG